MRARIAALLLAGCPKDSGPVSAVPDLPPLCSPMNTTSSGLRYCEVTVGNGEIPAAGQQVVVHYTGWLEQGARFDSSLERGEPFGFTLGAGMVIPGWDEGLATMRIGGRRVLVIPPALGYGERDMGLIPPGSTLVFDVSLLGVAPPRPSPPDSPPVVAPEAVVETASGLRYAELVAGSGAPPQPGQSVRVEYTGWLADGTRFDSSWSRSSPIEYRHGQGHVIAGWEEGLSTLGVGGQRVLYIPAALAYGDPGRPPKIPPGSDLTFVIELVEVE